MPVDARTRRLVAVGTGRPRSPDQQKALYRPAPPVRLLYWLNRHRYQHLDQTLTHAKTAA